MDWTTILFNMGFPAGVTIYLLAKVVPAINNLTVAVTALKTLIETKMQDS